VIAELTAILKPHLDAYEEARQEDGRAGDACNQGNWEGDKLAAFLTDWKADNATD